MLELPELNLPDTVQWIRIPAELDVPVTTRVKALLDSTAMRRLSRISQLGLVSLVYPGATHSRLEHSLGVYRLAVQALTLISRSSDFEGAIDDESAKLFLIAALVHDIGHWPFCHPLEDMRLDWIPRHEQLARSFICDDELGKILREDWKVEPERVAELLVTRASSKTLLLSSLLNGPIDVDKMDYLQRDSLHAGVPYGRNFDIGRLISSLCLGPDGRMAITEKGKTAAEMMVFSRYVMFSEVYWHHAVRCATAMLQRVVFELFRAPGSAGNTTFAEPKHWLMQSEAEFAHELLERTVHDNNLYELAAGLFGRQRRLYKRLAQFSFTENSAVHHALARRPYDNLVVCAERLSDRLNHFSSRKMQPTDVLIDAPPVKLEVQFNLNVRQRAVAEGDHDRFLPLGNLSPVVSALATNQFDNFVKRVRVFVSPDCIAALNITPAQLTEELLAIASENPCNS